MIAMCIIMATGMSQYMSLSGSGILCSIGLYNLYVIMLMYLYSYSTQGKKREEINQAVQGKLFIG